MTHTTIRLNPNDQLNPVDLVRVTAPTAYTELNQSPSKKTTGFDALLETLGLDSRDYQLLKSCRTSPKQTYPFTVQTPEGIEVWDLVPLKLNKHRILGTWYGYPQCCIDEHITECKNADGVDMKNHPITKKKERLKENNARPSPVIPCWNCLEYPPVDLLKRIREYRQCSIKSPIAVPGVDSWIQAVIAYVRYELKPWSYNRSTKPR